MLDNQEDKKRRKEESCTHDHLANCKRIEEKQDNIKKQRAVLQEVEEQIAQSTSRAYDYYQSYAYSNDLRLYQIMNTNQSLIYSAHTESQKKFSGFQEELAAQERKLTLEREEREKQYKKDIRELNSKVRPETTGG